MSEQNQGQQVDWEAIRRQAGPYPLDAYHFVREGLSYTADTVFGEHDAMSEFDRHVTGQELCLGLKNYAVHQWGMMAPVVLDCWGIHNSSDFGRIVFAMIDAGLMSRRPDDCIEDFDGVFDFREVFSDDELAAHIGECNAS
ncbi:MAG: hypothetical protein MK116_05730 [Phycisphaerales bacterium]|nr:hypothetical protein [Phycisphaerales bacterium]